MISTELIINTVIENAILEYDNPIIKSRFGKDYPPPDSIKIKGKRRQVTPDLVIESGKKMNLYIVAKDIKYDIEKWRLLSLFAMKLNGNLYIVAPSDNQAHISKRLEDSRISARIIYFSP